MIEIKEKDLKSIISNYLRNWIWFLISILLTISIATLYLRYSIPEYSATAKIQILEDKGSSSEFSVLKDINPFSSGQTKIEDEIQILNSRSNFIQVVKNLKLNLRFIVLGKVKNNELYGNNYPFEITFLAADSIINKSSLDFFVDLDSETSFKYSTDENELFRTYDFGSNIKSSVGDIILTPKVDILKSFKNQRIKIEIRPLHSVVEEYQKKISIGPAGDLSNIINISLNDSKLQRGINFINNLIETNNNNAVDDKKAIADRTSEFIEDRISEIYSNLSNVDQSAETFKEKRGIADLGSQSNVNFTQSAASEQQLQNANIELNIANSMQDLIQNQDGYDIIPTNVGLSDPGIANSAQRYNELISQRNRLLESSNEKNPVIVKLDQQLESLRKGMQSSLNNVANNLNLQVNSLSKQLSQINSRIYAAPSNERALRDISRKQQTTESLYLYLLQKREESQITFASASPKSKVIDYAYGNNFLPVSPKPSIAYLAALIIGFLLPFTFIYVKDLMDNKIHNKNGLEFLIGDNYPVLAEIPRLKRKENKLISAVERSVLGESLRILRTNLDYLLNSNRVKSNDGKVILISSSVPGEGKTFLSSNLAMIFASTNRKVLLLGADIRNPKLYDFYSDLKDGNKSINKRRTDINGLTEYLYTENLKYKDIVNSLTVNDNKIDVIYSGQIPPNPSELLLSKRMKNLFDSLKNNYDYIIVDSAPLLVVTDTLLISKYADQIIYVTKAGFTEEKVLRYPVRLHKEGKLKNLNFVVNSVKSSSLGYGGKYGYGYGEKKKLWWEFYK